MSRLRYVLIALGLTLLATPVLLWTGLRLGLFTPALNYYLDHELDGRSPLRLRFGAIRTDLLTFIEADDVVLLAPLAGAKVPLLTVSALRLEGGGWAAVRRRLDWRDALRLARVKGLNLFVLRDAGGAWNWSAALPQPKPRGEAHPKEPAADIFPLLLATRLELDDSQVVFNDETRDFHSTVDRIQGSLDARSLPLLAFSLSGRTEGQSRDNISMAGEYDHRDAALFARLDLGRVPLSSYLNYFLPGETLRFTAGTASLSLRLTGQGGGQVQAAGRADVQAGALRIPGVSEPLSELDGRVLLDAHDIRFQRISARFLDSQWTASGGLFDLRQPRFDVQLNNAAFQLQALSKQIRGVGLLQLSGTAAVEVSMTGKVSEPLIQGHISSPRLEMHGIAIEAVEADVKLEGADLDVPDLHGRLWSGDLEGSTAIVLPSGGKAGRMRAQATLNGSKLEEFRYHDRRLLPLSGTAGLRFEAEGRLDNPDLKVEAAVAGASLVGWKLGQVSFSAGLDKKGLQASLKADAGRVRGSFGLSTGSAKVYRDSYLELDAVDIQALASALADAPQAELLTERFRESAAWARRHLTGVMDARLSVEGPLPSPRMNFDLPRLDGRLRLDKGWLAMRDAKDALDLRVRGRLGLDGERLYFGKGKAPFHFQAAYKDRALLLDVSGHYPLPTLKGKAGLHGDLVLKGEGDLRLLDVFDRFKKSSGSLRLDLGLGGSLDSAQVNGLLEVDGFSTLLDRYAGAVKNGKLRAVASGQKMDIEVLKVQVGGQIDAHGQLDFSAGRTPSGLIEAETDAEGLRFENWPELGQGSLVLQPLQVRLHGGSSGAIDLSGRLKLRNAVVTYGGSSFKQQTPPADGAPGSSRPLNLDLHVALGSNVWYENHHNKEIDVSEGFAGVLGSAYESAMETLLRPDMYFRLKPTDDDFLIQGETPKVLLSGELAIDRGKLTLMENDFEFRPEAKPARIVFNRVPDADGGARATAEISARAVARMRYMRDNALTGRPTQKAVNVIVDVTPMSAAERRDADQEHAFLNYKLDFLSDPLLVSGNDAKQREAILSLIVLGDPLNDDESLNAAGAGNANPGASELGMNQVNRLLQGELRKQFAKISRKGLKFMGSPIIDVFRVVPRFKYGSGPKVAGGTLSSKEASKQAQENQLVFSDLTLEIGKSLFENLYASFQYVRFGQGGLLNQNTEILGDSRIIREEGTRLSLEYQIGSSRSFEGYFNYSVDDNLEPVAFEQDRLDQARNFGVRFRNTLPTDNYSATVSRKRRFHEAAR